MGIALLGEPRHMMVRYLTHRHVAACRWTSRGGWRRKHTHAAWPLGTILPQHAEQCHATASHHKASLT
jgi:hypothetical protein